MAAVPNVGFIGLGNIGMPVARRLIGKKFRAHVFDIDSAAVKALASEGAVACNNVAELAAQCTHIGICVRDDIQVEALLYGDAGLLASALPGTLIAVHSTVARASILRWGAEAQDRGLRLIDAPLTGGAHRAEQGSLCYMVGGSESELRDACPVLDTSAEKIVHAGTLGSGIALKLCNNFIQYAEFVAMAEATRLAQACGLSPDVLRDVGLANGVVNEQMHLFITGRNAFAASASETDMDAFFGAMGRLGRKDLECALATAADGGVQMPTAEYLRDRIEDVFLARDESRPVSREDAG